MNVELAETMVDGWRMWLQFEKTIDAYGKKQFPSDVEVLKTDAGRYIALIRMVARRRENRMEENSDDE